MTDVQISKRVRPRKQLDLSRSHIAMRSLEEHFRVSSETLAPILERAGVLCVQDIVINDRRRRYYDGQIVALALPMLTAEVEGYKAAIQAARQAHIADQRAKIGQPMTSYRFKRDAVQELLITNRRVLELIEPIAAQLGIKR